MVFGFVYVIVLQLPFDGQDFTSVKFTVNEAAGDAVLISKSGKGVIRLDHEDGITIYPPTYKVRSVSEEKTGAIPSEPRHSQPCTVTYLNPDPGYAPKMTLHSKLDCGTLWRTVPPDAIFDGRIR